MAQFRVSVRLFGESPDQGTRTTFLAPPVHLWVPKTLSTSCDEAILMDHSAEPIRPLES